MKRRTLLSTLGLSSAFAGCLSPFTSARREGTAGPGVDSVAPMPPNNAPLGYTHLGADGNRVVDGVGSLPDVDFVDVPLDSRPEWVVGVPHDDGVLLAVVARAGTQAVTVGGTEVRTADVELGTARGPPLLVGGSDPQLGPRLGSETTHPVPTTGGWAFVDGDGVVHLPRDERVDVGALPDARLVSAGGRLYVLAGRTREYAHGVLGDEFEARSVAVLDPSGEVAATLDAPSGVIEGIAPIVADVDDDGASEVVVTTSDAERGARVVALSNSGETVDGPPVGTGFRWRHQLAVAPFGPDGEMELAVVKTPHIGGTAEFYRAQDGALELVAERAGYSTHAIGSRNLDTAVAGDVDGDGRVELLVPDDPQRTLVGLRRVAEDVEEAWRLPLGGQLATNVCAVSEGEKIVVAAGRADALRVWPG